MTVQSFKLTLTSQGSTRAVAYIILFIIAIIATPIATDPDDFPGRLVNLAAGLVDLAAGLVDLAAGLIDLPRPVEVVTSAFDAPASQHIVRVAEAAQSDILPVPAHHVACARLACRIRSIYGRYQHTNDTATECKL